MIIRKITRFLFEQETWKQTDGIQFLSILRGICIQL